VSKEGHRAGGRRPARCLPKADCPKPRSSNGRAAPLPGAGVDHDAAQVGRSNGSPRMLPTRAA
jgi:hypothetical protein